jgi:5'-nucleotidase
VQASINDLRGKGIKKIILVTHIGYEEDQKLATELSGVSVIVGGHSHTPLGTPDLPGWRKAGGPYPTKVKNKDGKDVIIVQAWEWGKVVGKIKLNFDENGGVSQVVEAKPIVVDETIPEDPQTASLITALQKPVSAVANADIGSTPNGIPRDGRNGESLMGNVIADAMLAALKPAGAVVAFINQGGIRASIDAGKINYGNAVTVQPFNNSLVTVELTGAELLAVLEQGALSPNGAGGFLHPSAGTSYRFDKSLPDGKKITDVKVAGKPLDLTAKYICGFLSFTASGGDSHFILRDSKGKRVDTGFLDIDALVEFIKKNSPLDPKFEGRIRIN